MAEHIFLVDQDDSFVNRAVHSLRRTGYLATSARSGGSALRQLEDQLFDLIVLQMTLPDMSGFEVLRQVRRRSAVPVVLIAEQMHTVDEVIGLNLGADDYLVKPCEMDVLVAHIRAILRRCATRGHQEINVGDLRIDPVSRTVFLDEDEIILPPKEFGILLALAENLGSVLSAEDLVERVWGGKWIGEMQTVYVHIRWLREKIEFDPGHPHRLVTVKGAGYKLNPIAG